MSKHLLIVYHTQSGTTSRMADAVIAGAISSIRRILAGLAVREVQEPILIAGEFDESRLAECEELGLTLAAGLEAGVF